jgi:hypothetical protein
MHKEVFRLDRQGLLDVKLVARVIKSEIEILQKHSCCEDCFLPSKGTTDTTSHSISERFPTVVWELAEWLVKHSLWDEGLCIVSIDCRIAMDLGEKTDDWLPWLDLVLPSRQTYAVPCWIR